MSSRVAGSIIGTQVKLSYSPDYDPIEKLWKKIKEKDIHLHYFPTFESLINKVEEALIRFKDLKNEILSFFGFYDNLGVA